KTDRQSDRDSEPQRAKDGRHGIFAYEVFSTVPRAAGFLFCFIPRLAHGRGKFVCCSTKLLTPNRSNFFCARLNRRRQRFVPRKIVFVRINHTNKIEIDRQFASLNFCSRFAQRTRSCPAPPLTFGVPEEVSDYNNPRYAS